ncbi:MAG: hypothetical protein ACJAQT_003992 [Akkermansiaceae bacterium]|jgi:hypothetical protein
MLWRADFFAFFRLFLLIVSELDSYFLSCSVASRIDVGTSGESRQGMGGCLFSRLALLPADKVEGFHRLLVMISHDVTGL